MTPTIVIIICRGFDIRNQVFRGIILMTVLRKMEKFPRNSGNLWYYVSETLALHRSAALCTIDSSPWVEEPVSLARQSSNGGVTKIPPFLKLP